MEVKGDLRVRRTLTADRRANEGLSAEVLSATRAVVIHDYAWLSLDPGAADRDVTLPDATTLPVGWKIVIANSGAANDLVVKDGGASPTTLKTITNPPATADLLAYQFVLIDNSDDNGTWYVIELGDPGELAASKFVVTFVSSDFPAASGGYRTLTGTQKTGLLAANHGRGVNPILIVQELVSTDYDKVLVDRERVSATGDVTLRVTDGAEFDGRVVLV